MTYLHARYGFLSAILFTAPVLAQTETAVSGGSYRIHATLAVLPGNPYDWRLYSIGRAIFTPAFRAKLRESLDLSSNPGLGLDLRNSFEVTFQHPNPNKALVAVNWVVDAVVKEIEKRRAVESSYGTVHAEAVETTPDGAKCVIRIAGPPWGERERRRTQAQLADLRKAVSNPEAIRRVSEQINGGTAAAATAAQIQKTLIVTGLSDSRIDVSFVAPDPEYMRRLLESIPRRKFELAESPHFLDLDFLPVRMRTDWYIFNCCELTP